MLLSSNSRVDSRPTVSQRSGLSRYYRYTILEAAAARDVDIVSNCSRV